MVKNGGAIAPYVPPSSPLLPCDYYCLWCILAGTENAPEAI